MSQRAFQDRHELGVLELQPRRLQPSQSTHIPVPGSCCLFRAIRCCLLLSVVTARDSKQDKLHEVRYEASIHRSSTARWPISPGSRDSALPPALEGMERGQVRGLSSVAKRSNSSSYKTSHGCSRSSFAVFLSSGDHRSI